jgi:hypothetical protein
MTTRPSDLLALAVIFPNTRRSHTIWFLMSNSMDDGKLAWLQVVINCCHLWGNSLWCCGCRDCLHYFGLDSNGWEIGNAFVMARTKKRPWSELDLGLVN